MRQNTTKTKTMEALIQMIQWSLDQEKYLERLIQTKEISDEQLCLLKDWKRRCSEWRNYAENQKEWAEEKKDFSPQLQFTISHIYQSGHQLYQQINHFLQKVSNQRYFQPVSDRQEPAQPEAAQAKKPDYQPVPIGGHILPPLPYPYDALEPHIDQKTMQLHHDKHHQSYVDGLNKAEKEMQRAREHGDFSLIKHWEREAAFHGAGHYLHTLFWLNMSPKGGGKPRGEIAEEIKRTFGSFEKFKQHFSAAAENVEGSGWALLVWAPRSHRVEILQAEKHQNLSQQDVIPLMAIDVWEHSYYLKYQNNRKAYIEAWWNVVNWDYINYRYRYAHQLRWKPF